jgi:Flp pilus assembly pilin Flp
MSPGRPRRALRRFLDDLRGARHIEAYAIAGLAFAITILSVVSDLSQQVANAVILACLGFLVFSTAGQRAGGQEATVTSLLRDRDSFGTFDQVLDGAAELWMYAPSAINVLQRNAGDLRRWAEAGGRARVVVHDPDAGTVAAVRAQLDRNSDFGDDLEHALRQLRRLTSERLEYRLLDVNPGFSLVVVNPRQRSGRVIVEFHGFRDNSISDRMHIDISRTESMHWFEYWADRFEAIWDAAREPKPDPDRP